jgi:hypothetical protein
LSKSKEKKPKMDLKEVDPAVLRDLMIMAQGGDPRAQQTLNEFLNFNSNIERTNLPKRRDVRRMIYCDYASKVVFANRTDNPFRMAADSIATGFMAYKSGKSNQFVELMRKGTDISSLMIQQGNKDGAPRKGVIARLRGNKEED